ncbi:MAG: glycosyltransferase family 4 protein [Gammaproteobacteria bacterium]|nr:glycosyltransferase family 4 protein [Gammaproteobacteria bacterium]
MTGLVRRYSLRHSLIDIPNERNSHVVPTPRGGGLGLSVVVILAVVFLALVGALTIDTAMALAGGGLMVSAIGWIDDHKDIAASWRALAQIAAACWALFWLGGVDSIDLGVTRLSLGWLGTVLGFVGLMWITNLYNFMDGTDGFAAIQCICAGIMGGLLFYMQGEAGLAMVCFVMASASSGFLIWNWPPAKIFMGDVGSYLIGFTFGVLVLAGERTGSTPALIWSILLAIFVWDATLTLLRRAALGEKWYAAHRSHAYQRLVQLGVSHRQLAIGMVLVNVFLLWPLAYLALQSGGGLIVIAGSVCVGAGSLWFVIQRRYRHSVAGEGLGS